MFVGGIWGVMVGVVVILFIIVGFDDVYVVYFNV